MRWRSKQWFLRRARKSSRFGPSVSCNGTHRFQNGALPLTYRKRPCAHSKELKKCSSVPCEKSGMNKSSHLPRGEHRLCHSGTTKRAIGRLAGSRQLKDALPLSLSPSVDTKQRTQFAKNLQINFALLCPYQILISII